MTKRETIARRGGEISLGEIRTGYELVRSDRRTLEIAVTAGGRIEVRAPSELPIEHIERRLRARKRWIRRRLLEHDLARPDVVPRTYTAGETHRYLGRQYRLAIESEGRVSVSLSSGRLRVSVPDPKDAASVRRALQRWYRARAKAIFPRCLDRLLSLPGLRGVSPSVVRLLRMRARWGSCTSSGQLILNTDLVRLPVSLIDYVLAHELCHLRVRRHDARFDSLLFRVMPDWRARHQRLSEIRLD